MMQLRPVQFTETQKRAGDLVVTSHGAFRVAEDGTYMVTHAARQRIPSDDDGLGDNDAENSDGLAVRGIVLALALTVMFLVPLAVVIWARATGKF